MGGSGENKTSANVLAGEVHSLASSYQLAWSQGLAVRDWLVSRNSKLQGWVRGDTVYPKRSGVFFSSPWVVGESFLDGLMGG